MSRRRCWSPRPSCGCGGVGASRWRAVLRRRFRGRTLHAPGDERRAHRPRHTEHFVRDVLGFEQVYRPGTEDEGASPSANGQPRLASARTSRHAAVEPANRSWSWRKHAVRENMRPTVPSCASAQAETPICPVPAPPQRSESAASPSPIRGLSRRSGGTAQAVDRHADQTPRLAVEQFRTRLCGAFRGSNVALLGPRHVRAMGAVILDMSR